MVRLLLPAFTILLTVSYAVGQELTRREQDLFETHARPFLSNHCVSCHGEEKQEGGLKLTSLAEMLNGGDSGPAIVPGKPDESLLVSAIHYDSFEMPPSGKLDAEETSRIETWIQQGAPWPRDIVLRKPSPIDDDARAWWCFQPIANPTAPRVDDPAWSQNPIDQFVLAKLTAAGLSPSTEASREILVRRLHFSITGLPPSESVLDSIAKPEFDSAALIDQLLDSDAYGENQARYWLDLVRYADSDGYRADHSRPNAYMYRDYVIDSFNQDTPYDRFIREQLAGDEIDPGNRDALVATMYLRHWIYEHNQRDVETQWHEILSDITETTSDVFLAQGLKCARCHDHKFDPLLQKDYFRMKAFFAAFQPSEAHPLATVEERTEYLASYKSWDEKTDAIRKQIRELEHPVLLEHATREGFEKFIPKIRAMIRKRPEERGAYEKQIAGLAERQFDLPKEKINEWLSDEQKLKRDQLYEALAEFDDLKPKPLKTMKFVGSDVGPTAPATYILDNEDAGLIEPGFLTLLDPEAAKIVPPEPALESTGRRSALANWIASPRNPLTARVIVNRIWQQHFGQGLVETASDFGHLGTPPSHPDLLDWLASRFIEDGWSIKKLHRRILTSATYRQSSRRAMDETAAKTDPANRLLWRMNPRRLSGEEINDVVVNATGKLKKAKRAIYKPVRRNSPDPILAAFDSPDRIRSMGKRHRTTTPSQALLMGNGSWGHDRAVEIADRFASPNDDTAFFESVFRTLLGRDPSQEEILGCRQFLADYAGLTPEEQPPKFQALAKMPGTGNLAANFKPGGPVSMSIKSSKSFPNGDFTVEAIVLLRSLYKDASVRSIVGHWNGSKSREGWSLGITSTKSAYKPKNLILQLVGKQDESDKLHYEVVASNLRLELNKPFYVAASIKLNDVSESGITFYLKDLSNPEAKLQTANAKHKVTRAIRPTNDLTIGDRFGKHAWDGLIDQIKIETKSRDLTRIAQADSVEGLPEYVIDWRFEDSKRLGKDESGNGNHAWAKVDTPRVKSPMERAKVALVHAILNSNEMIYVD